jgi:hypothetical protein
MAFYSQPQAMQRYLSNPNYYDSLRNNSISSLSKRHNIMCHADKKSVIIFNINFEKLRKICKDYKCSGYMANETTAVCSNFGLYD